MVRSLLPCAALLIVLTSLFAQPNLDDAFKKKVLVVQTTIAAAQHQLDEGNAQRAVDILENNLPHINGNATYLRLLRDAYRQHIKDLFVGQQSEAAQKYLERLAILDKDAANDPALRAATRAAADNQADQGAPGADKADKYYQRVVPDGPLAAAAKDAAEPATVRDRQAADPFALSNQRPAAPSAAAHLQQEARRLLAQAENDFQARRFEQARLLYERAHDADKSATTACRDRWAYCMLNNVVQRLNGASLDNATLAKLTDDVRSAVHMAPSLANTGRWLIEEIEQRKGSEAATIAAPVAVQHSQRNGWQVAETTHFRIHHQHGRELAEQVANVAERTRLEVLRKWLGGNGTQWRDKCDVFLHADAQAYKAATGVAATSPGHSRIESEAGNVVSRRMDLRLDISNLLTGVLPHETTHVALAGQFGRHELPRWADEGLAVLSEPADVVASHRRNLAQGMESKTIFTVRELMHLKDYPQTQRVAAFYAQSVDLVAFLAELRGPLVVTEFLRDGLQAGFEQALQRHYGLAGFDDLQARWQQRARDSVARAP